LFVPALDFSSNERSIYAFVFVVKFFVTQNNTGKNVVNKYTMTANITTLISTTSKEEPSVEFYKDVSVMNYVLNEYILPSKMVAVTRKSDDGLTVTTTMNFTSPEYVTEFLSDPIIKQFSLMKQQYNKLHNITFTTEAVHG